MPSSKLRPVPGLQSSLVFASEFIPQTVQGNQTIQSGKRASVGPGRNTEKKEKEKKTDIHSGKCGKVQPFHPTLAKERGVGEEKASSTLTSQQYEIRSQFWSRISSGRDWDEWKMREGSQETLTTENDHRGHKSNLGSGFFSKRR